MEGGKEGGERERGREGGRERELHGGEKASDLKIEG